MENQTIRTLFKLLTFAAFIALFQSCYNDSVEELYPNPVECDTTNVSYANDVWPIFEINCVVCHSGAAPSGNFRLTNYDEISAIANGGRLLGAIKHENGYSPMPKGGNQLPSCDILTIEAWINEGTPNN